MIIICENGGLFDPFEAVELLGDRALCDGAEIPFSAVGACTGVDISAPLGLRADDCDLTDGELVAKAIE